MLARWARFTRANMDDALPEGRQWRRTNLAVKVKRTFAVLASCIAGGLPRIELVQHSKTPVSSGGQNCWFERILPGRDGRFPP